jgi:hypothetical protein
MSCEMVEVTVGPQTYAPVRHGSFVVGQVTYRTKVRRGESPEEAHDRALRRLYAMQERSYRRGLAKYLARLENALERAYSAGNRAP